MPNIARCWCGNDQLASFSAEYAACPACGTLVSLVGLSPDEISVKDDERDFYGKEYWLSHQTDDLGFGDIHKRAREDLPERALYWLRTVLKYKPAPARVLELGCAHGGLVALMRECGYDASGLELSAWVVDFARRTFDIPMYLGPIEDQPIAPGTLDAIVLLDVMEHLPDPVATMSHCLGLLKEDGVLIIQMPSYPESQTYREMLEKRSPFLEQFKANEHLYLFSERAARDFFRRLGAGHVAFEPAFFAEYDMFLAVSRQALTINSPESVERQLGESAGGRIIQALFDLDRRFHDSQANLLAQRQQVEQLTKWVNEARAESEARYGQIVQLTAWLDEARADSEARYRQIVQLTDWVNEARAETAPLRATIEQLNSQAGQLNAQIGQLNAQIDRQNQQNLELSQEIEWLMSRKWWQSRKRK